MSLSDIVQKAFLSLIIGFGINQSSADVVKKAKIDLRNPYAASETLPYVQGCTVEEYAEIPMGGANKFAFDSLGNIFISRDPEDSTKVIKIDHLTRDAELIGSEIAGQEGITFQGEPYVLANGKVLTSDLVEIYNAQTLTNVKDIDSYFLAASDGIYYMEPDVPYLKISAGNTVGVTIDSSGNIAFRTSDGSVSEFDSYGDSGNFLKGASGLDLINEAVAAPKTGTYFFDWWSDLYTLNNQNLIRIMAESSPISIGTGFNDINDLDFGPDGNLYLLKNDSILRIIKHQIPRTYDFKWVANVGQGGSHTPDSYGDVLGCSEGVMLTGTTSTMRPGYAFLKNYDEDGPLNWVITLAHDGGAPVNGKTLMQMGDDIIWGGDFSGWEYSHFYKNGELVTSATLGEPETGGYRYFLAKLNLTGDIAWAKQVEDPIISRNLISATSQEIFIRNDGIISFYDSNGDLSSGKLLPGTPRKIAGLSIGGWIEYGEFSGQVTFGEDANEKELTSFGETDMYLAKYDNVGNLEWIVHHGSSGADNAIDLETVTNNVILLGANSESLHNDSDEEILSTTGDFMATIDINNGYLNFIKSIPGYNFDLAKTHDEMLCAGITSTTEIFGKGEANEMLLDIHLYPGGENNSYFQAGLPAPVLYVAHYDSEGLFRAISRNVGYSLGFYVQYNLMSISSSDSSFFIGGSFNGRRSFGCGEDANAAVGTAVSDTDLFLAAFKEIETPTLTITPTFTPTPTDTYTFTPTFTITDTPTDTMTDTPTDTFTPSPTHTYTFTPTFTITDTPTDTKTDTPTDTYTQTATFTQTFTDTHTSTFTNTSTPSYTSTFTQTPTNTKVQVDTPTFTDTPISNTPTFTSVPTPTFTNTQIPDTPIFSPIPTPTFTDTQIPDTPTFSKTPTDSFTPTSTETFTPTYTRTETPSNTDTFTPTLSYTPTYTNTEEPTAKYTSSQSPTSTSSWTKTFTNTPTWSETPTNTLTPTFSFTNTSTITDTPIPSLKERCDYNHDNKIDEKDLLTFIQLNADKDIKADVNLDGSTNSLDLLLFQQVWHDN